MNDRGAFAFDASLAAGMRRRAFLPLLLILPLAAMFGADPSKSQPMHFLMSFGIGLICGGLVVAISHSAVNRRIAHLSGLRLSVAADKLLWRSAIGESEIDFDRIRNVHVQQRGGNTRAIVLILNDGSRTRIEGFVGMSELCDALIASLPPGIPVRRTWMPI